MSAAELSVVFTSDGYNVLAKQLADVQAKSKGAETATEQLTDATKKAGAAAKTSSTGYDDLNAHLVAYKNHLRDVKVANDNAAKSARTLQLAGGNLASQFADVGVSLAGGINPLMVLIQQGPQIAGAFGQASQAGLGFKAVISGLVGQIAPLIAAFAPWIAGLAAVGAGVYYLADAHKKHMERIDGVNKSIENQRQELEKNGPLVMGMKTGADLASDGLRNFDNWLKTSNVSLAEQNRLLRENALQKINSDLLKAGADRAAAQTNVGSLETENFRLVRGARVYTGKGSMFGGMNGAGYQEYLTKAAQAQDNLRVATEKVAALSNLLAKAGQAPTSAFANPLSGGRGGGGRGSASTNDNSRGLRGVADLTVDPSTVVDLSKPKALDPYKLGGDKTIGGDPMLTSAEDASKALQKILDKRAKDRLDTEQAMWSGLTALSSSGNKKLAAIGKAAAIAEATIDGIKAVQKAYASLPFPFNLAAAATMAGLTAINVAKIAGVQGFASGGYTGNGGIGQAAGIVHGQEFVVNAAATRGNRATLEAMNAGRAIPQNPANSNGSSGARVQIVPSKYFDAVVDGRAAAVAGPMADQAREDGAQQGAASAADQYVRMNIKRLA